jgi:hypothetical protein
LTKHTGVVEYKPKKERVYTATDIVSFAPPPPFAHPDFRPVKEKRMQKKL